MSNENQEPIPVQEEDDLDSFFAKKDKKSKKKKKKAAYVATEDLAKTLEKVTMGLESEETEESKKEAETKKAEEKDQNEWHDFDDDAEKDYSDLKIQNFQIKKLEEQEEIEQQKQYDDDGELILPKPAEGPWKNMEDTPSEGAPTPAPQPTDAEPQKTASAPAVKSAYKPPHLRGGGAAPPPAAVPWASSAMQGRKQEAPKLQSEIDFPTLSSAVNDTEVHKGFETVKQGSKSSSWEHQHNQANARAPDLKLGNQFSALRS